MKSSLSHNTYNTPQMLTFLTDLIFPRVCFGCTAPWAYICPACKKSLRPHPAMCPISHTLSKHNEVNHIQAWDNHPLAGCTIALCMDTLVRKCIFALKYKRQYDLTAFLGNLVYLDIVSNEIIAQHLPHKPIYITYIPSHRYRKYFVKWYNQSQLLGTYIYTRLQEEYPQIHFLDSLYKTRYTRSQVGLNRSQRLINLINAFDCPTILPNDALVIIVDDIITTGSSLTELARAIRHTNPSATIRWTCVARNA
jgi:predicted amidophosphoribosyltransferase